MPTVSSAPAPMPCTARNTTRAGTLPAAPQATEPARKIPSPVSSGARRPRRSENRPYSGTVTVEVNR